MSLKLLKSTGAGGSMTLVSRISGLVRDMAFAQFMGGGALADAFFVAFRIPNFFRRIFGEGAFSVAFVPVYKEFQATRSLAETRGFADLMAGRLMLVLLLITVAGIVAAPAVVTGIAPGFVDDPEKFRLTVQALRITFPYLFFICLVAMAGAILNSHGRFAAPAFTPVLLNLCLIAAVLWLTRFMDNAAVALAMGVFVAGFAQLAFQALFLHREGVLPRPRLTIAGPVSVASRAGVRQVTRLMLPALFGVSIAQINILVNTLLASFLVTGSVSWLYYSDRLMEFPLGVFGIALATAILPNLSDQHASRADQTFSDTLDWALRWVCLVAVPATVGLVVLAKPIMTTLFQHGAFSAYDVERASASLVAFALGLPALMAVKVLAPGFYARQNTRTPVKIGALAMAVNILVSLTLVYPLAHVGLALGTSAAAFVNAALLYHLLRRHDALRPLAGWPVYLMQVLAASAVMGAVLWWGRGAAATWFDAPTLERVLRLGGWVGAASATYVLCILVLGVRPAQLLAAGSTINRSQRVR